MKLQKLQCVTNAPEDYDYGWAKTVVRNAYKDDRGKRYRVVQNEDEWHFKQQIMRYQSGMHLVISSQLILEDYVRHGWLLEDEPVEIFRRKYDVEHVFNLPEDTVNQFQADIEKIEAMDSVKLSVFAGGYGYSIEAENQAQFDEVIKIFQKYGSKRV